MVLFIALRRKTNVKLFSVDNHSKNAQQISLEQRRGGLDLKKEELFFVIFLFLATHFFILYLGFNMFMLNMYVNCNHAPAYLTKASMMVNACQHIMPVGTIQKPCFMDKFCLQVL